MHHTQRYDQKARRPLHPNSSPYKRQVSRASSTASGYSRGKEFEFADLVHWNLKPNDQLILDYYLEDPAVGEKDHAENSSHPETGQTARVASAESTTDDHFVRKFLQSLRPSLEMHTESFERLGIDSEASLEAFSQWSPWDRERWIMSQNVYLCLTPLEISSFMLGVESMTCGL